MMLVKQCRLESVDFFLRTEMIQVRGLHGWILANTQSSVHAINEYENHGFFFKDFF